MDTLTAARRYPNHTNRDAAAGLRRLGFQPAVITKPRTSADTWAGDVIKYRNLMSWAFQYKPSAVGDWIAAFAEAVEQAEIERTESAMAGYRK